MQCFIQVLNETDPETSFYFIEYVTLYLNERNSKELKKVNKEYIAAFNILQAEKEKKDTKVEDLRSCRLMVELAG